MINNSHTKIIPYQQSWKEKFEEESNKLMDIFGEYNVAIEHIGSTSIPELSSKNIIDIAVQISHIDDANRFIPDLEKIGYLQDTRRVSTERHFFRKYGEDNFHLSICYKNQGSFLERQILFRDFLRSHNEYRDEYQKLKEELIQKNPTGDDEYISGKTEFVNNILELAGFKDDN